MSNLYYDDLDGRDELIQYLYDLQGYIVIENVLSADEVSDLREVLATKLPAFPED